MADAHRAYSSGLISEARGKAELKKSIVDLVRVRRVPDQEEIERAVRAWVLKCERITSNLSGTAGAALDDRVRDLGFFDAEVVRVMRAGRGEAPLTTRWMADNLIQEHDWTVPPDGELRALLENRVARGQREVAARIKAELTWEDQPQPTHRMFAPEEFARDRDRPPVSDNGKAAPLMMVFEGYLREQKPSAATVKAWKSALRSLIAHLGHDDASSVSSDDIIAWKNALLAPGSDGLPERSQYTVRHKYIGAVKPVFGWAVQNKLIAAHPVLGVRVSVPRKVRNRSMKGFSDAEAKIVLRAASEIDCTKDKSFKAFACRWLPWLCAYTGARVGELAQLRRQDVRQSDEGIWYLRITPEAGSQKGGFARDVAIHEHLIEQGFLVAIKNRSGPIFYDPDKKREGSDGNPQHKKVGDRVRMWVRSLGISDPELQPNHGWRHRFVTLARTMRMDPDVSRAICGHGAKDTHYDYGDTLVQASAHWLNLIPRYEIAGA